MATFHWVTNAYVLLLIVCFSETQFFDFYDSISYPSLPLACEDDPAVNLPNITTPSTPRPPINSSAVPLKNDTIPELVDNCTVINPNGSLTKGNALFIILDSKSLQTVIQVVEPCNTTSTNRTIIANSSLPTGSIPEASNLTTPALPPKLDGVPAPGSADASRVRLTPTTPVPSHTTVVTTLNATNDFARAKRQVTPAAGNQTGELPNDTPDTQPIPSDVGPVPGTENLPSADTPSQNNATTDPPLLPVPENPSPTTNAPVPGETTLSNAFTEATTPEPLSTSSVPTIPPTPVPPMPGTISPPTTVPPPPEVPPTPGTVPPSGLPLTSGTIPPPGPTTPGTVPPPELTTKPPGPGTVPPAGNSSQLVPPSGVVPPIPGASTGLLCNLLTLIQTLVDSILQFVFKLLKQLINLVISLLRNILRAVLGQLLPSLLLGLEQLITNLLNSINRIINLTLLDLLGINELLSGLLVGPSNVLSGLNPQQAQHFNQTVIDPLTGLITEVEGLLKDLLIDPNSTTGVLGNIVVTLNHTLDILLEDVEIQVDQLLTDLLGSNSSLVVKLTSDLTTLLKNVLGDTVCNVQKLLTDSNSLSSLLQNILKLIQNLLNDALRDIDTLLVNILNKLLADKGLLDNLLRNILKIITDLLKNLLTPKLAKLKNLPLIADPNFKAAFIANMTNNLRGSTPAPNVPLVSSIGSGLDGVIGNILSPILQILDNLINVVEKVIVNLDNVLANKNTGLLNGLLNSIRALLNNLLENLGQQVSILLGSQLNISNFLNPSALLGPLGTLVSGILKQVVCDMCNNPPGTSPPVTSPPVTSPTSFPPPITSSPGTPPPVTSSPVTPPPVTCSPITPKPRNPCIPIYCPPVQPPSECIEDTLFDNVNDADGFVSGLNQYQDYINRNVYGAIGGNSGNDLVGSLLGDEPSDCTYEENDAFPLNLESLPIRLINGLTGAEKLTNNVASSGLWNLINALTNTTSSSATTTTS